jgi:spore germination cell wall hydrolase CwlJ-like protein
MSGTTHPNRALSPEEREVRQARQREARQAALDAAARAMQGSKPAPDALITYASQLSDWLLRGKAA